MGAIDVLQALAGEGVSISAVAGRLVVQPASKLTDDMREAIRASKPELVAMLTVPRTPPRERPYALTRTQADTAHATSWDGACDARFTLRTGTFILAGFHVDDAEDLAERLHLRDVEGDDRKTCFECGHMDAGQRCRNSATVGMASAHVGRAGAVLLRRCVGFAPSVV